MDWIAIVVGILAAALVVFTIVFNIWRGKKGKSCCSDCPSKKSGCSGCCGGCVKKDNEN